MNLLLDGLLAKKNPPATNVGGLLKLGLLLFLRAERTHTTDPASSGLRNPLSGFHGGFRGAREHGRRVYRSPLETVKEWKAGGGRAREGRRIG
jgi:hypothetical protein